MTTLSVEIVIRRRGRGVAAAGIEAYYTENNICINRERSHCAATVAAEGGAALIVSLMASALSGVQSFDRQNENRIFEMKLAAVWRNSARRKNVFFSIYSIFTGDNILERYSRLSINEIEI